MSLLMHYRWGLENPDVLLVDELGPIQLFSLLGVQTEDLKSFCPYQFRVWFGVVVQVFGLGVWPETLDLEP